MRRSIFLGVLLAARLVVADEPDHPFSGPGLLLPMQNRAGDAAIGARAEAELKGALGHQLEIRDTDRLRPFLRRHRLRDPSSAAPRDLQRLAAELGIDWYLAPVLHEVFSAGMPRITLSASAFSAGSRLTGRAGFAAASARQGLPWLGLGDVESLDELAAIVANRLATELLSDSSEAAPPVIPGTIAVVPFNAVTDRDAAMAAELATSAARAELRRRGVGLVFPGLVEDVQRRQGKVWRGSIDDATSAALREQTGADWILTGTIEILEPGAGPEPEPKLAFSARLIDTEQNRIVWMGGRHREGWDRQHLFGAGRIYSSGELLETSLSELLEEASETVAQRIEEKE